MSKHTPGPWVYNGFTGRVYDAKGHLLLVTPQRLAGMTAADLDANARLIAAAPELLETVKLITSTMKTYAHEGLTPEQSRALWMKADTLIVRIEYPELVKP